MKFYVEINHLNTKYKGLHLILVKILEDLNAASCEKIANYGR